MQSEMVIMSNLFSDSWMQEFATLWNADQTIAGALEGQRFNANIGYGFANASHPISILIIMHGKVVFAGLYKGQYLDWDLRADLEDWKNWLKKGLNVALLSFVVAQNKLQFKNGDNRKMLRTPYLATAFVRSFELMSEVTTEFVIPDSENSVVQKPKAKKSRKLGKPAKEKSLG